MHKLVHLSPYNITDVSMLEIYKNERLYLLDISDVSNNERVFLSSGIVCIVSGTLKNDVTISSVGSRFIFDNLKLDGGVLSTDFCANAIEFKKVESINKLVISEFNIFAKKVMIERNELDSNCIVNLRLSSFQNGINDIKFNLNNQKSISLEKRLLEVLVAKRDYNMKLINDEIKEESSKAYLLKLNRKIK